MPQGLSNTPDALNRCVANILSSVREFASSFFDDVFLHSRAMEGQTNMEVHRLHVRQVLTLDHKLYVNLKKCIFAASDIPLLGCTVRKHKLYANLKKCIFAASKILLLACIVGKHVFRPGPEKIKAITDWPVPTDVKGLRKFLGLAAYLRKYSRSYAEMTVHLSRLLKRTRSGNEVPIASALSKVSGKA